MADQRHPVADPAPPTPGAAYLTGARMAGRAGRAGGSTAALRSVVVVGAGPAGAATAIALAALGVGGVLLVDQGPRSPRRAPRVESLAPGSRLLLERLGVWDGFLGDRHAPCLGTCSSWGSDALGYNDYLFSPHGPGWHIDRARFDDRLVREAIGRGTEVRWGTRVTAAEPGAGGGVRLVFDDGSVVCAQFVVDATGAASRIGRALGGRRLASHRLMCASAVVPDADPGVLGHMGMLEAVPDGWWYAAYLPGAGMAVMVATDPAGFRSQALPTRQGWLAALGRTGHLRAALGEASGHSPALVVRSAPSGVLSPGTGDGWVSVGDAAASFDPLTGQGVSKALLDGLDAASAVAGALAGDVDSWTRFREVREARWADYCREIGRLYQLERRWPNRPFWEAWQTRPLTSGIAADRRRSAAVDG